MSSRNLIVGRTTIQRLTKELNEIHENEADCAEISIDQYDDSNLFLWKAIIFGPSDSPYENGVFELKIDIPPEYPFKPPKITFITKIFHPNINPQSGAICLDILAANWTPTLTIKKTLLSISSLMAEPNPLDPLYPEAAILYKTNIETYNNTVRNWVEKYAQI